MINKSIFKAYDIRGIYPADINEEAVRAVGRACVKMFKEGEIILAHDARHGSVELMNALEDSIQKEAASTGKAVTIRTIGLATTPMFYFLVADLKASGGCMVTASHNPKNYNGVKMVKEGAEMVSGLDMLQVIETL